MKQTLLLLLALICLNAKVVAAEPVISMTTAKALGETIRFRLSANADNTIAQVDFGNGTLVDKTIGTSYTTISGTLVGSQTVKIYGAGINAFTCTLAMLTSLDVTNNTDLTSLSCDNNQLTSLDMTNNTALIWLNCYNNQLASLDVTKNTALTDLSCDNNKLTSLDVTIITALTSLDCYNNQLTSLDVTKNSALSYLNCSRNRLTSLDVTNNTALTKLICGSNQLMSLDVSKNTALLKLLCGPNQLTFATLPISKATTFNYAPQSPITIAASFGINSPIDLSSQLTANGNTTTYTWKTENGTTLTAGADYTINGGVTSFIKVPTAKVYCELTNATFPQLSGIDVLKTTLTTIIPTTAVIDAKARTVDVYTRHQTVYLLLPQAAMVQVYDITGHLVKAQAYNSGNNSFEVAQKGVYIIKVSMNDMVITKKIVIK